MRLALALTLSAIVLAACSSATSVATSSPAPVAAPAPPPPPPPYNAAGKYSFALEFQGQPVGGTITITGAPGSYGGSVMTDIAGELPITDVKVDGRVIIVTADTPQGPVLFKMRMAADDTYEGDFELGDITGPLKGKKLS
jgi:hypothetical protein